MFYTGYAINLDDALSAAGNRHYFVTRWTSYMPMYLFSEIFGPYWGRLVLRLAMLLVLSECLWRLGQRFGLKSHSRLLGILLVVSSPMFVRAFTTDYPEHFILWASLVLIMSTHTDEFKHTSALVIGVLSMAVIIANPYSILFVLVNGVVGIVGWKQNASWKQIGLRLSQIAFYALSLLFIGYCLFRFYYQVGNVYQPTIDFIFSFSPNAEDGWITGTNEWLQYFTWIYLPPLLIAIALLSLTSRIDNKKTYARLIVLLLAIYLLHIAWEANRGYALEVPYYWSMSLAPFFVLLFLVAAQISSKSTFHISLLTASIYLIVLYFAIPQRYSLDKFNPMLLFITFASLALYFIGQLRRYLLLPLVLGLVWFQVGGPNYAIKTFANESNSPRYDLVYNRSGQSSGLVLEETIWFLSQMDTVNGDETSTFLSAGGWTSSIIGTYIPHHPFNRWITPTSEKNILTSNVRYELEFSYRPLLVIYGDPKTVGQYHERLKQELPRAKILKDALNPKGLNYRLMVLQGSSETNGEVTIPLSHLDRNLGQLAKGGSIQVDAGSPPGFVSFGPYVGLGSGAYRATIHFESEVLGPVGYFESFNDVTGESERVDLDVVQQGLQSAFVTFTSPGFGTTWQFRTVYDGKFGARFHFIRIEKIS
jgi:hypothetical protein